MRSIPADIVELGLFARRSDLLARGHRDRGLRAAVACGSILRVRKGWYSVPTAPIAAIQAWRVGGRLTGLSALRTYGIWTPTTRKLHLTVPTDARALRRPTDMRSLFAARDGIRYRVAWTDASSERRPPYVWRTSVIDALVHIVSTHDRVTSISCLDAALHSRERGNAGIVESDLDDIFDRAPLRARPWRTAVDGRAASGGETEFRLMAGAAGIPFVPQPEVSGVGHLDGQIGPSTFVEIDGAEWHDDPIAFKVDRDRDIRVASKHGRVLRFSYTLFRKQWPVCEQAMRNALDDDYRLAKTTDFPDFPLRLQPRNASVVTNLRRSERAAKRIDGAAG